MKRTLSICFGALAALLLSMGQPNMERSAVIEQPAKTAPAVGSDGYYFEAGEVAETAIRIQIVIRQTYKEVAEDWVNASGKRETRTDGREVVAFAYWSKDFDGAHRCTIYMVDPKVSYRPHYIGHELVHCMYGNFHPTQPKNSA